MRPWTVICIDNGTTKLIEVSAPFDQPQAHKYVSENVRCGDVVAMIPGNHANRADLFNQAK